MIHNIEHHKAIAPDKPHRGFRIRSVEEYHDALNKIRDYYLSDIETRDRTHDGAFDAPGWRSFTYLLQAAVRFEVDVLGLKIPEASKVLEEVTQYPAKPFE